MNTQTNDGGSAFPTASDNLRASGMTLRDYFAAAALQGMLAYYHGYGSFYAAGSAYQYADAMLAERKLKKHNEATSF